MNYGKMTKLALIFYVIIYFISLLTELDWLGYLGLGVLFLFLFFVAYKKKSKKDLIMLIVVLIIFSALLLII